jgi:multidrug efflux pump subunit AcrA (membrane-fusion protein)
VDIARNPPNRIVRYAIYGVFGLVAVGLVSGGLRRLRVAAPTLDKGTVWIDKVQRGAMIREVQGQGTLVPEQIRWISSRSNARVERVLVKPGAVVKSDTVILVLANSDLELAALEADRQLAQAQAELANLQATLNSQNLAQRSTVATITSDLADARRRARAD